MLLDIISVVPRPEFQLDLEFENGERRRFDLRPLLEIKSWNRLRSLRLFARASVDNGTVVWPGGIDLAPETLYDRSLPLPDDQRGLASAPVGWVERSETHHAAHANPPRPKGNPPSPV